MQLSSKRWSKWFSFRTIRSHWLRIHSRVNTDNRITDIVCFGAANEKCCGEFRFDSRKSMFWGDRYGKLRDPYGHHWGLATHIEDVSMEEMKRRSDEFMAKMAKGAGQS